MLERSRMMGLILLSVGLSVAAWAQNGAGTLDTERLGLLKETSLLLGQPVKDHAGKTLGKVEDLLVDVAGGQVVVALVSSGGDKVTPLPALKFSFVYNDSAEVKVDKKVFAGAPRLARPGPADTLQMRDLAESFRYFDQQQPALSAESGALASAARLLGVILVSQANEPVGQLKDIMVDVPLGRIVYLVVKPAVGWTSDYYAVPPVAVRADAAKRALALKCDRKHFAAGPHFQKDFWTDMALPPLALAVQQHYALSAASSPASNAPSAVTVAASPAAAAPARSDRELTQAVLAEIVHEANGLSALNLIITTVNGRVTVKGSARNEKQARQILAAAERVAGAGNVEDQLEYRGHIVVRARSN